MLCPWQEGRCARTKDCLTAATVLQLRHLHSNHQLLRLQADGSNGSVSGLPEITTSLSTPASSLFLPPLTLFSLFSLSWPPPSSLAPLPNLSFYCPPPSLSPLSRISRGLLEGLCVNPNVQNIVLNLSGNDLGSGRDPSAVAKVISKAGCVERLDVSESGIDNCLVAYVAAVRMNKSITHLSIGRNFNGKGK